MSSWQKLKLLKLDDIDLPGAGSTSATLPSTLESIAIALWDTSSDADSSYPMLDLIVSSSHFLRSISISSLRLFNQTDADLLSFALAEAAPQLEVLELLEGWWDVDLNFDTEDSPPLLQLQELVPKLVKLRRLSLHSSFVDPVTVFDSLVGLPCLEVLAIVDGYLADNYSFKERTHWFLIDCFKDFLRRSTSIKSVELPDTLVEAWFEGEDDPIMAEVEFDEYAAEQGCVVQFVA